MTLYKISAAMLQHLQVSTKAKTQIEASQLRQQKNVSLGKEKFWLLD
jgi:hypothetical protein